MALLQHLPLLPGRVSAGRATEPASKGSSEIGGVCVTKPMANLGDGQVVICEKLLGSSSRVRLDNRAKRRSGLCQAPHESSPGEVNASSDFFRAGWSARAGLQDLFDTRDDEVVPVETAFGNLEL